MFYIKNGGKKRDAKDLWGWAAVDAHKLSLHIVKGFVLRKIKFSLFQGLHLREMILKVCDSSSNSATIRKRNKEKLKR
jgi:hypothetical protein